MHPQSLAEQREVPGPGEPFDLGGSEESLAKMREYAARHGDFYRVWSPRRRSFTYVVNHPAAIKRVLLTHHENYTKGVGMDQVSILLGRGIMTSDGEYWRPLRHMLQPAFHRRVIGQFGATLGAVTSEYADRWEALARAGDPVNITEAAVN